MKKTILATAIVSSILSVSAAYAAPSFDANFELNTDTYDTETGDTTYDQNGRVELNAYSRHTSGENFFAGKGTVLLTTDGTATVDDAYIHFGDNVWSLKMGSFEGIDLFPLGKDTLVVHAIDDSVYAANNVRGRVKDGGGQIAFHYNVSDSLKFELDTLYSDGDGDGSANGDGDKTTAIAGVRPTVKFMTGNTTISAGFESVSYDEVGGTKVDKSGFGITANMIVSEANINVSVASSKDDETDKKITSLGANMVIGNFGAGVVASKVDNQTGDDPSLLTTYVAYSVPMLDIENATVTFAGSYSTADNVAAGTNDKTTAARVRFNYTF